MNPLTQEWIEKAEQDYRTALRESRVKRKPSYDAICFHAQQCVEKYLKALLQEHQVRFSKTHSLPKLLTLCLPFCETLKPYEDAFKRLTLYAVNFRYPGLFADKSDAQDAIQIMREARELIRKELPLKPKRRRK